MKRLLFILFALLPSIGLCQWVDPAPSGGNIYYNGGNVGIGTTSPATKLEVVGDISRSHSNGGALHFRTDSNGDSFIGNKDNFVNNGSSGNQSLLLIGNTALSFRTGAAGSVGTERIRINDSNGYVGIGTATPSAKLEVVGNATLSAGNIAVGTPAFIVNNTFANLSNDFDQNRPVSIRRHGSATEGMNIYVQDASTFFTYRNDEASSEINFRLINTDTESGGGTNANDNYVLSIKGNKDGGAVKIGGAQTPAGYRLSVDGRAIMEEVNVQLSGNWPDYVFEEDYDLPSLESVQGYIKENKHLPEVPSAKEMEENGIDLGEMNILLLKKVEELTLHLIEQSERINEQHLMIQELSAENKVIKEKLK